MTISSLAITSQVRADDEVLEPFRLQQVQDLKIAVSGVPGQVG
jgi:hypothetical protein